MNDGQAAEDAGARLTALESWLSLLFLHLTGARLRAHLEIDDLVQEVYLRVLSSRADLPAREPGEGALRRYLARVARSCVIDVVRCLRARKRSGSEVPLARSDWSHGGVDAAELVRPAPGPSTQAAAHEEQRRLMRSFEALPAEYRRVIGLRQLEGLSAAAAGRRMGRSESAVHSLYRRALLAWGRGTDEQ